MSDGVIHTAFIHDFAKFKASCETDRHAIEALGSALAGSDRSLIITSGTALLSPGRLAIEENVPAFGPEAFPRVASEEAALSMRHRAYARRWYGFLHRSMATVIMVSFRLSSASRVKRAFRRMWAMARTAGLLLR